MIRAFFVTVVAALIAVVGCSTGEQTTSQRAQSIEAQVWSPYCPGRLLVDCTTRQATELRAEIAKRLERGDSTTEVFAWIRRNYGNETLARPQPGAGGLAVWLIPLALLVGGAVIVAALIRRWTRRTSKVVRIHAAAPDAIARVRDEVTRDL